MQLISWEISVQILKQTHRQGGSGGSDKPLILCLEQTCKAAKCVHMLSHTNMHTHMLTHAHTRTRTHTHTHTHKWDSHYKSHLSFTVIILAHICAQHMVV